MFKLRLFPQLDLSESGDEVGATHEVEIGGGLVDYRVDRYYLVVDFLSLILACVFDPTKGTRIGSVP